MRFFALSMCVTVIVVIVLSNMGYGERAFSFMRHVPGRDVTGHFVLFTLLGFSVCTWVGSKTESQGWKSSLLALLALAALTIVEEFSQRYIPVRAFSWTDLSASLCGLLLGFLFSLWPVTLKQRGRS